MTAIVERFRLQMGFSPPQATWRPRAPEVATQVGFATVDPVDYRAIVTIDPARRGGKPCIRGLRITVYDVLEYRERCLLSVPAA
jgi:hypothetical protein